jgi:hypothetical protein
MKTTFWQQEWKKAIFLGLDGNEEQREAYVDRLKVTHVRPKEDEDELVWSKNPSLGFYTPRLGYKAMIVNDKHDEIQGWWKSLWKRKHASLFLMHNKAHIFWPLQISPTWAVDYNDVTDLPHLGCRLQWFILTN